jgi:hypothetical protein
VFDRDTGTLFDNPSVVAIYAIRQITLLHGKINKPCSTKRVKRAIEGYIQIEQDIKRQESPNISPLGESPLGHLSQLRDVGSLLFRDVFARLDGQVYRGELRPRVSSGATAERLRGNSKYTQHEWPERLEDIFPSRDFLSSGWRSFLDHPDIGYLTPGAERPVRVITVPKTLKTPRIIAIEPTAMQYAQQAILEQFEDHIRNDNIASWLIDWSSQTPNQELALKGSEYGYLATLDLSEASDRVSNQHVRALLSRFPHLARAVDATRSRKADVPGHGIIRLSKFASMGSALCFPMESMVFASIVFLGIQDALNVPLTRKLIHSFRNQVRIYGDDIIVPVEFVQNVISRLQAFGLVVNTGKSFWTGKFRESCGKDYYDGIDVSVIRCRRDFPTSRSHVSELESTVALRNLLHKRGFVSSVSFLDEIIERIIPFPYVGEDSPILGKLGHMGYETHRTDPDLQLPLVRGAWIKQHIPVSELDGWGALLKFFLKRGEKPYDEGHLTRAGRPYSSTLKIGWRRAY